MMSSNSLNRKLRPKVWILAYTPALVLTVLIFGCYQKISEGGKPHFVDQADQRVTLTEKDIKKFESSVKVIDGQAESHYKMALFFQKRKKHKFAIDELKTAVRLNPLFTKAYNAMGVSYDHLGNYSQAVKCYQSALKLNPNLDYVLNNLGYSYLLDNKLDEAIVAFRKAIELNDGNKRYRSNLGLAYVMKDQYDEAYNQFRIVEGDFVAQKKLDKLLDNLGKEKPDHYFAELSDPEPTTEKIERKEPLVIKQKIYDQKSISYMKADPSEQKSKNLQNGDEQSPLNDNDKKAFPDPDKDVKRTDQTNLSKGLSNDEAEQNVELFDPKQVRGIESTEKKEHQEVQTELKQTDQTAYSQFVEKDTDENEIAATDTKMIASEDQESSIINEKPSIEHNTQAEMVKGSVASSVNKQNKSAVESVSNTEYKINSFAGTIKSDTPHNKNSERIHNSDKPKIIEVDKSYYQDTQESNMVSPAKSHGIKSDLIETNQTKLLEKQPLVNMQTASAITSTNSKTEAEIVENRPAQRDGTSHLAAKKIDLSENTKSEVVTFEVEIIVANGNGVNGAAGRFSTFLKSNGFKVSKVTNANSFDHVSTKIFYCSGDKGKVDKILQQIPFALDQRSLIKLRNLKNQLKIIIGKDQIEHDKMIAKSVQ